MPFVHIPINKANKAEAEAQQLQLLRGNFDLVVLARYMQILSSDFLEQLDCPVINIHHSFLPAFVGGQPIPSGQNKGRETHWCNRALRHGRLG